MGYKINTKVKLKKSEWRSEVKRKMNWNEILNWLQTIAESTKDETAEMIHQLMQEIEDSNEYLQTVLLPDGGTQE